MFAVGVSNVSLLNVVAQRCMLPRLCYLWEFASDDTLLAGVEVALPSVVHPAQLETMFFWDVASDPLGSAHEMVAGQVLRCLQHRYGFIVHDYNFQSMLAYRRLAQSVVQTALSASGCVARFKSYHGALVPWCDDVLRACSTLSFSFFVEDRERMGSLL